jgi:hypothetical protein
VLHGSFHAQQESGRAFVNALDLLVPYLEGSVQPHRFVVTVKDDGKGIRLLNVWCENGTSVPCVIGLRDCQSESYTVVFDPFQKKWNVSGKR